MASLIFFHTARIFDDLDFYIKNEPQERAVSFVVVLAAFWGMPLMFSIAGFAVWHSLQKRSVVELVRERVQRLLVPFLFGVLLIVPPQIYFREAGDPAYRESFAQFYPQFFDISFRMEFPWFFGASPDTGLFQPANTWFLYILLLYTMLLLPVFIYLQKPRGLIMVGHAASLLPRPWAIFLPAIPVALIEAGLGSDMTGGWNQGAYLVFILYGFLFAADARFAQAFSRHRKHALFLAVAGSAGGLTALSIHIDATQADPLHAYDPASVVLRFIKGVLSWCWIVAILGYIEHARELRGSNKGMVDESRAPSRRGRILIQVERYANEAVLPFYLLHQTVIVVIGYYAVRLDSSALLKFLVISLASFAVTLLLYEFLARRTRLAVPVWHETATGALTTVEMKSGSYHRRVRCAHH